LTLCHCLFFENETSGKTPERCVSELKLGSTVSALLNFPVEITWITSKDEANLEICPSLKTSVKTALELGSNIDSATGGKLVLGMTQNQKSDYDDDDDCFYYFQK